MLLFEKPYIFLLVYSFFIMLFFTQSSPFFVLNLWVDANAFLTVGKGMVNGVVPYRDLFEQKGPLLYGLHALAYMISNKSFFGVYILEAAAMFVNLLFAFKISKLYLKWMPAVIVALFFPLLILNQSAFAFGDSAEEFSIPFLLAFLYMLLKHLNYLSDSPFKWSVYLINGILIGCVFWIKFTLVGAWVGFYLAVLLICITKNRWRELVSAIVFTFAGLAVATIPWLLYFGIHHALKILIEVYFKFNLTTYSSQTSITGKLINSAVIFGEAFSSNLESRVMIIIGLLDFMFTGKYLRNKNEKWLLFSSAVFLIWGVYFGGREYSYYYLMVTPLGLLGLIAIAHYLQQSLGSRLDVLPKSRWFTLTIIALSAFYLCFSYNSNIKFSKFFNKDPLPQQTFAQIMDKEPHPTMLNYSALDGGFYLLSGIVPNVRYFEAQNIDYTLFPENMDEQNRYIKEGKVQFVVVKYIGIASASQLHIPHLSDHYQLVAQQDQVMGNSTFRYFLYKQVK